MSLSETMSCGCNRDGDDAGVDVAEDVDVLKLNTALQEELKKYIRLGLTFAIENAGHEASVGHGWTDVVISETPSAVHVVAGRLPAAAASAVHGCVACHSCGGGLGPALGLPPLALWRRTPSVRCPLHGSAGHVCVFPFRTPS